MKHTIALAFALLSVAHGVSFAGPTFLLAPSSPNVPANGLMFSPNGGPFEVTNSLSASAAYPGQHLYLDFSVGYQRTDANGNVFFGQSPTGNTFNAYIFDAMLAVPPAKLPPSDVLANATFVGGSEARFLGSGVYLYTANLIGNDIPGAAGPLDVPATLTLRFDVTKAPGHQVISGSLAFGDAPASPAVDCGTGSAVPEPASAGMLAIGLAGLVGIGGWVTALHGKKGGRD